MERLQDLIDDAVVGGEHHAPAQRYRNGRQQIRQQQQGTHGFLTLVQAVDEQCHCKADEHLKNNCKDGELDGVPDGLLEIGILEQLDIVLENSDFGRRAQIAQQVVVGEAVEEGKDERIGRHDQQDDDGRGKHADTEAFGLAFGGIEFGVGSFHNSGLAIPGG